MASLNQLVSEIIHISRQPNSVELRRQILGAIIHARNEIIRKSYNNHHYADRVLQQKFRIEIIDTPDGDLYKTDGISNIPMIKRSKYKVPRPTRLPNNLPFLSIRTVGLNRNIEIPFAKEAVAQYYKHLPGLCDVATYDYINGYIYIRVIDSNKLKDIGGIIVESIFELPHIIDAETNEHEPHIDEDELYNNEFLISEDIIGAVMELALQRLHLEIPRETNTTSEHNKLNS